MSLFMNLNIRENYILEQILINRKFETAKLRNVYRKSIILIVGYCSLGSPVLAMKCSCFRSFMLQRKSHLLGNLG